jgi:integrase
MWRKGTIMELTSQPTPFENAIQLLETNMKKKSSSLPSTLRKSFILLLQKNSDLLSVKGKKLIIPTLFYPVWIKEHKLNNQDKEIDATHYKFFRTLHKYGYIHTKSSYFPKKQAVITLNPTLPSLYKGNLKNITNYTRGEESLYRVSDSTQTKIDAYIDLRIYQLFMLTLKEIEAINTSNIVFIDEKSAYIYIEDKGIFDNIEIAPYHLIPLRGSKLINLLKQYKKDKVLHPFKDTDLENQLTKHRHEFFPNMSMHEIRLAAKNQMLMSSTPLLTTLATSRKVMSAVTIAELHSLYPYTVPRHLMKIENARISNAHDRSKDIDDEDNFIDSSFSLEEFDYFDKLLQAKNSSSFIKKIAPAKRELKQYADSPKSEPHGILITKYIVHLLSSIDGANKNRKIEISTFRNYYFLLKKHLFENIEDLSNVQAYEINEILQNLAVNRYKDKSIAKVRNLIADFFKFHGEKHNVIPMNLATYPKSLVFTSEIDPILKEIDESHKKEKQEAGTQYKILRDKAIILLARYSGLRKSELRSRLIKDIYVYDNELCIDVNSEGLRKLDLKLKTVSAKRRVCTIITNNDHLEIITKYMKVREKVRNKNPFLFLHVDDHKKIKSKVVKEDIFNQIGKVIQGVTGRYTSFHSLRHTFATYAVRDILLCKDANPYRMIDLAVKMGHTSPEITLKKYTHRSVIEAPEVSNVS